MIRVLHLITGLGSGGAEAALFKLIVNMDRARFENHVLSLGDEGVWGPRIKKEGIPVVALHIGLHDLGITGLMRLIRALQRFRPHIVQTWMYHANLVGLVVGRLIGVPALVWNLRCADMDMKRYSHLSRLVRWLGAWLSPFPQVIVVNSEAGRKYHEKVLGYRSQRWKMIGNGFDTNIFRPDPSARARIRAELGLTEGHLIIGMVARFDPMKDHDTFLTSAAVLRQKHDNVRFVLVGRDVDERNSMLCEKICALGLAQSVLLLGERHDIANLDAALDVATLVSGFGEGFPNAVGEAMSCGVPCVVSDVGDCAAVVGDTGRVIPRCDTDALVRAWEDIIGLGIEGRRELGALARSRIEQRFSIETMAKSYEAMYVGIANGAGC